MENTMELYGRDGVKKLQRYNVFGSRPLLAIDNIELYLLAFPQGLEAVTLNS